MTVKIPQAPVRTIGDWIMKLRQFTEDMIISTRVIVVGFNDHKSPQAFPCPIVQFSGDDVFGSGESDSFGAPFGHTSEYF